MLFIKLGRVVFFGVFLVLVIFSYLFLIRSKFIGEGVDGLFILSRVLDFNERICFFF